MDAGQRVGRAERAAAAGEDARHTAAAVGARPAVLLEGGLPVDVGDGLGDLDLGRPAHLLELHSHGVVAFGAVTNTDEAGMGWDGWDGIEVGVFEFRRVRSI